MSRAPSGCAVPQWAAALDQGRASGSFPRGNNPSRTSAAVAHGAAVGPGKPSLSIRVQDKPPRISTLRRMVRHMNGNHASETTHGKQIISKCSSPLQKK